MKNHLIAAIAVAIVRVQNGRVLVGFRTPVLRLGCSKDFAQFADLFHSPGGALALNGLHQSPIGEKQVIAGERGNLIGAFADRRSDLRRGCHGPIICLPVQANNSLGRASAVIHSARSAMMGSIRVARRAGMYAASNATTNRSAVTAAYVAGSLVLTPNTIDRIKRVSAYAATPPTMTPTAAVTTACRKTDPRTFDGLAPSAMRTPSSRVRRATEYASTP